MQEQNMERQFPPEENISEEIVVPKKKGKIIKRIIYFLLLAVFIGVFIYSATYIANYMVGSKQQSDAYDDLSSLRDQYLNNSDDPKATLPSGGGQSGGDSSEETGGILPEYQELFAKNEDMVGWISIPDTDIDYPVLQTPTEPNYYLYKGFDKKHSQWGCLYVREACDVFTPCDNVVIYGHNMKDGSMFADLLKFQKKKFWQEHQTFTFDTIYERHTYQIIAVFKTSANVGKGFSYHLFNTAANEEEFNTFIETVHDLQYYDTGLTATYGDVLLTLSTCEYTLDNGRFVVIAKRIS